ncbi:MAG TPA: hypothetical protein PLY73_07730, partial [Candidatus Ozemobacteraceae bacterium]|nr:hypothetical protein [Candidatus Ozemobacteraceae bacterium]
MNEQTWHPRDLFRSGLYLAGTVILLVSIVALITASGCGGGGGGGITGLPLSQVAQNGTITGRVVASDLIIASRLAATTQSVKAGTQAIANADVWLEQLPTFHTRTDSEGRFTLTGVPLGSYRVVAKLFSPLTQETYKIRSVNFSLGEDANAHNAGDLGVKKAVNQVSGILRDNTGRPLPFARMALWGETFTTDSNGYFITPPLPEEETGAEVTVVGSSEIRETVFEVAYISGTIPVVEISVPTQTQTPQAPVARIAASSVLVTPNQLVTLSADADDPLGATRDRLGFTWSATAGQLASGSYPWTVRWTAPAYDTVATVSVVVVNGSGLSGTARVPITVGAGGVNQRPAISNV